MFKIPKVLEHPVEFSQVTHKRRHKDFRTESANISKVHFFKERGQKSYQWSCRRIDSLGSLSENLQSCNYQSSTATVLGLTNFFVMHFFGLRVVFCIVINKLLSKGGSITTTHFSQTLITICTAKKEMVIQRHLSCVQAQQTRVTKISSTNTTMPMYILLIKKS